MINKIKTFLFLMICFYAVNLNGASWEDWELGGELGLAAGSGSTSGRILSPAIRATMTRNIDNKFLEITIGYMYGSDIENNFTEADAEFHDQEVIDDADQEVNVRLSVLPMTINFFYIIYNNFYAGAGVGLYHVFYKQEPLGDYRVNPDSEPGEIIKSPSTTALGFQQMIGIEIFPLSKRWSWFIGLKTFFTASAPRTGGLRGITFGGKVRYTW